MKYSIFFFLIVWSTAGCCGGENSSPLFEFSKPVYKIKGSIRKQDGDFVIMAENAKGISYLPQYLPEEYKRSGIEVTFDGELGKALSGGTALNLHRIWVSDQMKEKYKLIHKAYDLN